MWKVKYSKTISLFICLLFLLGGCSSYQPTKNVWKTTKGLWNTYVSPPANVDYEDKADLSPEALALTKNMQGIDVQLTKLERTMQNADKPPTQEWLNQLFDSFPWLNGFAGVKYNGTILGQQPPDSMKELDFNPLLHEDKKQSSRALRTDIQPSPLGPEIMLATPLYDGVDFLGIVVAYFDMRSLMRFSENPQDLVILAPSALLWPGKYEFAATPLAGVDWEQVVTQSSAGTCSNATGSFIYMVRYLGNLPLVFATPSKGEFPEGNGGIEQGFAYFPTEREKVAPPDLPERKNSNIQDNVPFAQPEDGELAETESQEQLSETGQAQADRRPDPNEIQPGSRDSVLLRGGGKRQGRELQERQLEGENVEVERVQRHRTPVRRPPIIIPDEVEEAPVPEQRQIQRPSPFGPPPEEENQAEERIYIKPSPFGPPPGAEKSQDSASETGESSPNGEPAPEAGQDTAPESGQETPKPESSGRSTTPAQSQPSSASEDADNAEIMADGETVPDGGE